MQYPLRRLAIFFALTFSWSWTRRLLIPIVKADSSYLSSAMSLLGGFGPSLAAVTLVAMTGGRRNGTHTHQGLPS